MNKLKVLILFFLFFAFSIYSQEWKEIGKTNIFYSDFSSKRENVLNELKYEYFKKENSIITVEWTLGEQFEKLFKKSPQAFDDIFLNAYSKYDFNEFENNDLYNREIVRKELDTALVKNIDFDKILFLSSYQYIKGYEEFIWFLKNGTGLGSCYINIIFKKEKNSNKFNYIAVKQNHCEI